MMYDYDYLNKKAKPYGGINKIFDELSDYAEEFIIGYLEAKCGCKISKEDVIKEAIFTSVWDGYKITTPCSNHYIIGVKNKKKIYSELHDRDLTKEELQRYGMKIEEQLALNTKEDAESA